MMPTLALSWRLGMYILIMGNDTLALSVSFLPSSQCSYITNYVEASIQYLYGYGTWVLCIAESSSVLKLHFLSRVLTSGFTTAWFKKKNVILPWRQYPFCSHLDQLLSGPISKPLSGTLLCLPRIYLPILLSAAPCGIHGLLFVGFLPHIFYYIFSHFLKRLNVSYRSKNIFILSSYLNHSSVGNLILGWK